MANAPLSSLTAASSVDGTELLYAVKAGADVKMTVAQATASKASKAGDTFTGPVAIPTLTVNDTSSVPGSAENFFQTEFFGNPASGVVCRFSRILVGEATVASGDYAATGESWADGYERFVRVAQLAGGSAIGGTGTLGYSRTSDFRTWAGSASGGSQGITGFALNDDTTPATTPIAAGIVGMSLRATSVNGITLNQLDTGNAGAVVDTDPHYGVNSGSTYALGLTAGTMIGATAHITALFYLGAGNAAKARKGIISFADALDTSVGGGGGGVFAELARGQSVRWINSSHGTDGELWADASGVHVAGRVVLDVASVPNAVNDAAAATASVPVGGVYRNGSALMVRVA